MAIISSVVATGRRMNGCDGFIASVRRPNAASCRRPSVALPALSGAGAAGACRGAVGIAASARTLILAPSRSLSAPSITMRSPGAQPGANLDAVAVGDAELDRADRDGAVGIDEIDERAGHAALDARRRHRGDVLVGVEQQPDVDELVRIERLRFVRKLRAQLDRAGGGIDLAVEGLQRAVGDLVGAAAIVARSRAAPRRPAAASRSPADCLPAP